MVPSSSYYIIRTEILILQWNKAGMTFLNWNQLWLRILFRILNVCVLCRWSSSNTTVWSPAPTWVWCSPACTSFIELELQWLGWRSCSGALAAWSGPRLGTSRSSTSPSRSPSTRCSYAYLVEFRNFYINIDNIRRRHLLNIHNMRTKKRRCLLKIPFVSFTLSFQIVDFVGKIWDFIWRTACSRSEASEVKAVGAGPCGGGQCLQCLLPEHDLPGKWSKVTMSKV